MSDSTNETKENKKEGYYYEAQVLIINEGFSKKKKRDFILI